MWQGLGNVLVRKAVETIPTHPFVVELAWDGKTIGNQRMAAVKRGIKACNIWDTGQEVHRRRNPSQIGGLVEGRQ